MASTALILLTEQITTIMMLDSGYGWIHKQTQAVIICAK